MVQNSTWKVGCYETQNPNVKLSGNLIVVLRPVADGSVNLSLRNSVDGSKFNLEGWLLIADLTRLVSDPSRTLKVDAS
jgi:hypothetical protein